MADESPDSCQNATKRSNNAEKINLSYLSYVPKTMECRRLPLVLAAADSPVHTTAAYYECKTFGKGSGDVTKTLLKRSKNAAKMTSGHRA